MIVGVIGSGSIGPDLAYGFVTALAGEPGSTVYLVDVKEEALQKGVERIRGYVKKALARGKLAPKAAQAVEAALVPTLRLADLADCEYVLEAATENLALKRVILRDLEAVVGPDCLIGFATSGIPRRDIAAEARHPNRCFVNHPFYPAWRTLPIEIVLSDDAALGARMLATMKKLGKVPIVTADVECFAADDVFCNYISEAARIVAEGLATPAEVDKAVNDAIGGGGPFNVMDLTSGNKLVVHCQELMRAAATGTPWFAPPALLATQGATPWHDPQEAVDATCKPEVRQQIVDRILAVLLGRAFAVVDDKTCEPSDFNWLLRMSLGFDQGTLELAESLGMDKVHALVTAYAARFPGFPVPPSIAGKKPLALVRDLRIEKDGAIATIRVFRPEVRNALCARTLAELERAVALLGADPSVKGIVLTSSDGAFAGADIHELAALRDPEACAAICRRGHQILGAISASAKPVVAALDGPVLGGGAELSMACHARVVGRKLVLGQPEVDLGIIPGYGGSQRLPRLVGLEAALPVLRSARTLDAAAACKLGWAHGEPAADAVAAAKALLGAHLEGRVKLAPVDPRPLAVPAKLPAADVGHRSLAIDAILVDVVRRGLALPLPEGLELEAQGFARCKRTVDMDIGMKNFIQNGPRVPAAFLHE
ncbi:MAG: enoyl-CoA hydratase/isomerase family protein [Polyangiaceae bacterium]|nr:enoyl-CoA hydratase/isomerase family protein [Polyangiaceae bacterium]